MVDPNLHRIGFTPRFMIRLLLLLLLCSTTLFVQYVAAADTPGTRSRKFAKSSSVFSLFNLKSKSKFWSESVIRGDFDDLERTVSKEVGRMAVLNYTSSGNLANYMKLTEIDSIYLSVPVNFVFIGFDGKGNHEFKLGPEELERWFTKIDHVFEHTRIPPVGEVLAPFYKIAIDRTQRHHLPLVSHVNHNFSVHAILLGEKVTSVFEYAIRTLSSKEDVDHSSGNETRENVMWQVDMDRMEYIFETLIKYLQIQDSYNIFVLNPKRSVNMTRYGYRRGLSESEIKLLKEDKALQNRVLQSEKKKAFLEIDKITSKPLYHMRPLSKFAWTTTEDVDTMEWSKMTMEALESVERFNQGKNSIDLAFEKAVQMLHGRKDGVNAILGRELKSDLEGLHSDCLTDSWIGRDRWAFVDLSAGPFTWGPAVGGEGVRTELSLPNVGKTIGAIEEITEDEAEEKLQDAIRERFSSFNEENQAIDILLAEMDIYEIFSFKHCKGRRTKLSLCEELDQRMKELKEELEGYHTGDHDESHKRKAIDALKRMEGWNLFTETPEKHVKYTVARDSFLAHLGSTLWGAMRHVIAPSVSDRPYHFYEKISFQLYFITQKRVRSINQLPVDLNALKEGLNSLVLPSQTALFTPHLVTLDDDPSLAMAFAVSRHAAAVPVLLVNGTYRSTVRTYLDSSILQHQLQRLKDHDSMKGEHANARSTLEIPVFWFIHTEPVLLLDKHHQSKSLPNMVLVVQSESSSWETHFQCNGHSLLQDLRNPIKAAVAATAEHLGGLLPLHLVYSHAHDAAIEEWTWSIGCNPLSITSQGWIVSQFQVDTIARNYIITSVEESIQVVNSAIQRLIMERTTPQGYKLFKSQERTLIDKYNSVVGLWRRISSQSGNLRYGEAVKLLSLLEESSHGFAVSVNTTISMLHPVHCTRERKVDIDLDMTTIPAFILVFGMLWFLLRPRRAKPKIN
ncbi:hypothetical protein LUZ61_000220 [Rhynchospora tenuis]|uniref:DUF7906 domain-containing protein n=1 Tax=Rhynchospora tenuis TaxID=198213 RepID=A0AAD5ZEM4_9POAL|nr:hypothetical protein LUZ61_000220 [Rhynchospora tenuis]